MKNNLKSALAVGKSMCYKTVVFFLLKVLRAMWWWRRINEWIEWLKYNSIYRVSHGFEAFRNSDWAKIKAQFHPYSYSKEKTLIGKNARFLWNILCLQPKHCKLYFIHWIHSFIQTLNSHTVSDWYSSLMKNAHFI